MRKTLSLIVLALLAACGTQPPAANSARSASRSASSSLRPLSSACARARLSRVMGQSHTFNSAHSNVATPITRANSNSSRVGISHPSSLMPLPPWRPVGPPAET